MKMQLLAVCLFMPILACSAQFDWLMNYRVHNVGAPQQQREFGFIKPSTTPKPLAAGPKQRRDGIFGIGTAAEFVGGSSSFTPLDTAPVDNPVAEAPGDSSTGTQGSDWDINLGGTDYGGDSGGAAGGGGGGGGGAGGASGGTGGLGGTSGASGGTFADGGNLNPGYDDSIQKLANGASAGSIAGIVIGVIILLSVLAGISFFVMRQVHRKVQVNVTRA